MFTSSLKRSVLCSVAAAAAFAIASPAFAEAPVVPLKPATTAVKSVAGVGKTRFDWLAKRDSQPQEVVRVSQKVSLGSGSWVWSPAGFGQKSHCYAR